MGSGILRALVNKDTGQAINPATSENQDLILSALDTVGISDVNDIRINPATKDAQTDGSQKTQIVGSTGIVAEVNEDNQLHVVLMGKVDTDNSSVAPLGIGAVFTGEAVCTLDYGFIFVTVFSDVASAVDGLIFQQSSDGTNWDNIDNYSYLAGTGKTYSVQPSAKWFRVVYTNGGTGQGAFRIQTILKKTSSLPSSHRISDNLSPEDDATLGIAIIKGQNPAGVYVDFSATTGGNFKMSLEELESGISVNSNTQLKTTIFDTSGNAVGVTGNALDIHDADIHTKVINRHFIDFDTATENPSVAIDINDTVILVASTTGFIVGDSIVIKDAGGDVREHLFDIVALVVDTSITLNRKIDIAYTTSATIEKVLINMAVAGSLATPKTYVIAPPSDEVWHITRVLISITDQTAMDDSLFGGIGALTNGVILEEEKTPNYTITGWKTNADMKSDMYDVNYSTKAPAGFFGLTGRFTFEKAGAIVRLDGALGDKLEVYIQDDLTNLDTFEMKAQGHLEA